MSTQPIAMPCPKCATPMRTLERSGIQLETCPECRGVFLDRGELDRFIDFEAATTAGLDRADRGHDGARLHEYSSRPEEGWSERDWDDDDVGRDGSGKRAQPSPRRDFLRELFEGFGD